MILVQSRRQLLSGSKILLFCIISALVVSSCGIFGGGKSKYDNPDNRAVVKPKKDGVDTVNWTKIPEDKFPPIESEKSVEIDPEVEKIKGKKDEYRIACFIPMEAYRMDLSEENTEELRNIKYINYYAGLKMAIEDLENEGIDLTVDIFDSREEESHVKSIISNRISSSTDVIMGPLKKNALIAVTEFGMENDLPVISPWYSSQSITKENPNYIQLTPFLTEHYRAITEHALANFDADQIYLVGREGTKDVSRFKYFQEKAYEITEEKDALQNFIFDIDSLTYEYEIFKSVINPEKPSVFILPNFSFRDAQYIYDVLRRINVEKMDNEVYVYGMPILHSMDKLTYEYYTNLNVRIVMSRFVDRKDPQVATFVQRYFREYNEFPLDDAFEGYDNMMYLGRSLNKYGLDFVKNLDKDSKEYFSTRFNIHPVHSGQVEEKPIVNYYENINLRIIQFQDNQFRTVR